MDWLAVTVPTEPVAETPVSPITILGETDPTLPVADTPVNATTVCPPESELNGVDENAELPNMAYGVCRLRIKV
jgi:hypothetical protein